MSYGHRLIRNGIVDQVQMHFSSFYYFYSHVGNRKTVLFLA